MRKIKSLAIVALAFALIACTKPIPTEKADYLGEWHGVATPPKEQGFALLKCL